MNFSWDPSYWLFIAPAMLFMMFAQWKVSTTYAKWRRVPNERQITGAQAAQVIMRQNGINVGMRGIQGELTDNYDPRTRTLNLSQESVQGTSVASLAIVAHELGHAHQDANNYFWLKLRAGLVPAVNIGSQVGPLLFIAGLLLNIAGLMWIGIMLFGMAFIFAIVTLPVELNASNRAIKMLDKGNLINSASERQGARSVLSAAALTYVAGTLTALVQLLYYVSLAGRSRRSSS